MGKPVANEDGLTAVAPRPGRAYEEAWAYTRLPG
jgi:hypothetical protein